MTSTQGTLAINDRYVQVAVIAGSTVLNFNFDMLRTVIILTYDLSKLHRQYFIRVLNCVELFPLKGVGPHRTIKICF